jgi:hypothetical protein
VCSNRDGEPGFSVKLNTLPISKDWNGLLVLVPPFVNERSQSADRHAGFERQDNRASARASENRVADRHAIFSP